MALAILQRFLPAPTPARYRKIRIRAKFTITADFDRKAAIIPEQSIRNGAVD